MDEICKGFLESLGSMWSGGFEIFNLAFEQIVNECELFGVQTGDWR